MTAVLIRRGETGGHHSQEAAKRQGRSYTPRTAGVLETRRTRESLRRERLRRGLPTSGPWKHTQAVLR